MRVRKLAWGVGFLALASVPLRAQETPAPARPALVVRTAQGTAVPGATLKLTDTASGRAWVGWTDGNGQFDLSGLPAGKYRIEAEQIGFEPGTKEIELPSAAAPTELTLRIAPPGWPAETTAATAPAPTTAAGNPPASTKTSAENTSPGATKPGTNPPQGQKSGQRPDVAEMVRQRLRQAGFQQVDPTGQGGSATLDTANPVDTGPLGDASSSDAFLINGTVGRGAAPSDTAGGPFGGMSPFGGTGGPGGDSNPFGGQPGQGGFDIQMRRAGQQGQGGRGGGQGQRGQGQNQQGRGGQGQQAQGAQRQSFGEGTDALYGLQRILRQQVNRIRVSFYDRYGNSAFDARPYSLTQFDPPKIPTWRERFGANIGGPLRIPKVYDGREKTFFFINYNLARTRDPVDTFATVPLPQERMGDFSARGVQLFDPQSSVGGPRTPFGTSIPAGRLDAAALGLLKFIPLPNLPGLAQNFHLQTRVPTASDTFNIRVLHTISPKLNAQVTYNLNQAHTHAFQSFPDLKSDVATRGQNVMLGLTQNWTQRLIHDTRVFWSRSRSESLNRFAFLDDIGADLGITGISTDPINFGVPLVSLTNFTGANDPVPALRRNQTLRFLDNVSYARPKHTLRAGMEIRRMQLNLRTDPVPRGSFTFTGLMTSQLDASGRPVPGTGFDFADFLLGLPQSTSERFGSSSTYFRSWGFVGYFSDDWRIHPRFTLNWGIRYEAVTPPVERFNHIANLDVNSDFTAVAPVVPGQAAPFSGTLPRSLVRGDYNNWSPRIGIAWKPPLRWAAKHPITVRAGYGVFYNMSIYNQLVASMANQPPWAQAQVRLTSAAQELTLENGFPPAPPTVAKNTVAVDPNYKVGYAQIWNATIETQLQPSLTTEITYTGTKGTHLDLLRAPNRAPPGSPLSTDQRRQIANALGFTYDTFGAASIYHALQLRVERRFARGLMLQGQYTYGKSIDNASSIGGGAPVVVQDDQDPERDRGLSSFDIRHQFRSGYVYELPFGERKRWARNGWEAGAFGNWTVNGSVTVQSGTPFTARVLGTAADNTGTGGNFSERADQISNPSLPAGQRTPLHFFNTTAFVLPAIGRFGDAGRNTIEGPGNFGLNFALAKLIRFGRDQQRRIDLRWEVSNFTNTPNFTGLSTVVNSATYGRVLGTRGMRTMDFQMRANF